MKDIFKKLLICFSVMILFTGCDGVKTAGNKKVKAPNVNVDEKLSLSKFIPNKSYKVVFDGTDLAPNIQYIKGNGIKYQTVGTDGRGTFVNIYDVENGKINCVKEYNELSKIEENNMDKIDFLNKNEVGDKTLMLWEPIKVESKDGNSKILEIGKDLKLDKLELKGVYVKVEQVTEGKDASDKTIITSYYSEGLGRVKYDVNIGGSDVCYYVLKDYMVIK